MRAIRWFFKAPPMLRAAAAVIFLAICAGLPRPGTTSRPAGVAQGREHPRWVAGKTQPGEGDSRPRPDKGREGETRTAAPGPAAVKGGKSSPQAPLTPFKPSEKIKPGQAVDFPTDI